MLTFLDKESLDVAKTQTEIIVRSLSLRVFDDESYLSLNPNKIKFKDFVEEVCYYSVNKKDQNTINDKYELELEIKKFKLQLGGWLISSFEN